MKTLLKGGTVVSGAGMKRADVLIDGEKVSSIDMAVSLDALKNGVKLRKGKKVFHKASVK